MNNSRWTDKNGKETIHKTPFLILYWHDTFVFSETFIKLNVFQEIFYGTTHFIILLATKHEWLQLKATKLETQVKEVRHSYMLYVQTSFKILVTSKQFALYESNNIETHQQRNYCTTKIQYKSQGLFTEYHQVKKQLVQTQESLPCEFR